MDEDDLAPDHLLVQFTRGDQTRARYLRSRLSQVADRTSDPELADALRDVAAGRRSMRELGQSEVFGRHGAVAHDKYVERTADRSAQDRLRDQNLAAEEMQHVMGVRLEEIRRRFEESVGRRVEPPD
ncbi:hypothetical protein [Nocardioides currus]|uniref:Uncharacterized protein n=1 Tax=Nocardioides currus TaxID=2133958 RepID=A0A2R7Z262_9ACTN|nr:hypothetical protein [Nocardioides currus]PUA82654.1 hypothetical protein C7S10_02680 [Nocardioides currus]